MNTGRLHISIALISAAIIAFQLALIQIISIVQWYHFAYMVIAVAMLGFGAAGSFLAVFQKRLADKSDLLLPFLLTATGMSMALVTDIAQLSFTRFDSYLLFAEYSHIGRLLFTYGLFFIPFFMGALVIGLLFVKYVDAIGKLYFSNLVGSGAGGILAILLLWRFLPNMVMVFIAVLPVLAGLLLVPAGKKYIHFTFSLLATIIIGIRFLYPPKLHLSEYKDLSKTMLLPGARIISEKPSPYGIVQVVTSPVLRYAPGLSLAAKDAEPVKTATFINGNWFGAVAGLKLGDTVMILDQTTAALPYIMSQRKRVLVLQAGTGMEVLHALSNGARDVVAVEANPVILSVLKNQHKKTADTLFTHPKLLFQQLEPRSFLSMDTAHYDLVVLPIIGVFGGSSGLSAMQEQFILTREAFTEMWHRLNQGGAVTVTAWMDYPVRDPLKILATMVEVLQRLGIAEPTKHIVAVRSWGTITFVLTKDSLSLSGQNNIRRFCDSLLFDPAILPQLRVEERARNNQFQDKRFFTYLDNILSPGREDFYEDYDFNIRPATDNKPFFSQYIKWSHFSRLAQFFGNRSIPFFGIGYLLVIVTFLQVLLASFLLIVLPLFKIGFKGNGKTGVLLYFAGIGLGYMFVEMILIQHFILYFGNPVLAASAVISSLLVFSGAGSYFSGYISERPKWMKGIWVFILVILPVYAFGLTFFLQQTVQLPTWLKWLAVLIIIAPPAFCMGIPFPSGLLHVSKTNPAMTPWAWGINGCMSVISTVLATILAVELGFTWVMLFAVLGYSVAFIAFRNWR